MLKKIISTVLVLAFCIGAVNVFAEEIGTEFFDFELLSEGAMPSGELLEFSNPVFSETVSGINNMYLGKAVSGENNIIKIKKIPQKLMIVNIALKEIPGHATGYVPQLQLYAGNGTKVAAVTPNFYGGTLNNDVTENNWSNITIRYNFITKTNEIYLNGVIKDTDRKAARKINEFNADGAFNTEGSFLEMNFMGFYIDNVKVSVDDEKFEVQDIRFNGVKLAEYTAVPLAVNDISLVFDAAVKADTIEGTIGFTRGEQDVEWEGQYDSENKTYHILISELIPGEEYTISVSDSLTNSEGIPVTPKNLVFTAAQSDYLYSEQAIIRNENTGGSVKVKNATFNSQDFTLVLFVYDDKGLLVDCIQSDKENIGVLGECTLEKSINTSYPADYKVVMTVWDCAENALPLMDTFK